MSVHSKFPKVMWIPMSAVFASLVFARIVDSNFVTLDGMLRVMTGNYLIDAILNLVFVAPVSILTLIVFIAAKRVLNNSDSSFDSVRIVLAEIFSFSLMGCIIFQLIGPASLPWIGSRFIWIRASIGMAFWVSLFSFIAISKTSSKAIRGQLQYAILSPILLCGIIPWSLARNGISWTHLVD